MACSLQDLPGKSSVQRKGVRRAPCTASRRGFSLWPYGGQYMSGGATRADLNRGTAARSLLLYLLFRIILAREKKSGESGSLYFASSTIATVMRCAVKSIQERPIRIGTRTAFAPG